MEAMEGWVWGCVCVCDGVCVCVLRGGELLVAKQAVVSFRIGQIES